MAINKISEFPKVTPSADDKILIEKNGEGGHINLSEMPVSTPVNTKITGEVNSLKSRIDNLTVNAGDSSAECADARVNADGSITYPSLKARLDAEHSELKGDLSELQDVVLKVQETIISIDGVEQDTYPKSDGTGLTYGLTGYTTNIYQLEPNAKYIIERKNASSIRGYFVAGDSYTPHDFFNITDKATYEYTNVSGYKFLYVGNKTTNNSESEIVIKKVEKQNNIDNLAQDTKQINSEIESLGISHKVEDVDIVPSLGFMLTTTDHAVWNQNKQIVTNEYTDNFKAINELIPVESGKTYKFIGVRTQYSNGYAIFFNESGSIHTQKEFTAEIETGYLIPDGVTHVALSMNIIVNLNDIKIYVSNETDKVFLENVELSQEQKKSISSKLSGKTIVNFGDSIFGQARPPQDVSTFLAEYTGATVYNCGFGGCRMGKHTSATYDAFSMYRLADAIATGDWTLQDTHKSDSGVPDYFAETVSLLKSIDWSTIDICTIAYGTNDFGDGLCPYKETASDTERFNYVNLALKYSIETLLTAYPNLRIFILTPTYRFWQSGTTFVDDSNSHEVTCWVDSKNYKLTDFVESIKNTAKEYQLPIIDNYYDLGFNMFNRSVYYPVTDGTHQNITGRKAIANHISNKLF